MIPDSYQQSFRFINTDTDSSIYKHACTHARTHARTIAILISLLLLCKKYDSTILNSSFYNRQVASFILGKTLIVANLLRTSSVLLSSDHFTKKKLV